ncbi:MAG: ribulose phosphate epimerase, partial [Myxococcota bacterium]
SLMCISAAAYGAGCAAAACCTSFCDVDMGDTCPVGAQECLNYYAPGSAPPGFETVGVCAEPI